MSSEICVAPTRHTRAFHVQKAQYGDNSIKKAVVRGQITLNDAELICNFVTELKATRGISLGRSNKLTFNLVGLRRFIGEFTKNSEHDIYDGINRLNDARIDGHPYKQNTRRDLLNILKRFYLWLIVRGYSTVLREVIEGIKVPRRDTMTKTVDQMFSEEQIHSMIEACLNSRDRAILAVMYDGGFRVEEMGTLSWGQVKFDEYGAAINVNEKTTYPRYIRITSSAPLLAIWKNDYPFPITNESLVFLTTRGLPLEYNGIAKQLKTIARRAAITKRFTPHLVRHSKITHWIQKNGNESILKKMMWGNINTNMLATYLHLTNDDIDREVLTKQGIEMVRDKTSSVMNPKQCANCHTINAPTHSFCSRCGQPLSQEVASSMEQIKREIEGTSEFKMIMELIKEKLSQGVG